MATPLRLPNLLALVYICPLPIIVAIRRPISAQSPSSTRFPRKDLQCFAEAFLQNVRCSVLAETTPHPPASRKTFSDMNILSPGEEHTDQIQPEKNTLSSSMEWRSATFPISPFPSIPPSARIHDRLTSMESFRSKSPTLADGSGFLSEVKHDHPQAIWEQTSPYSNPFARTVATGKEDNISPTIRPIRPSDRPRYERDIVIENITGPWKFGPLETLLSSEREVISRKVQVCSPWQCHVHPEGQPYYSLKEASTWFTYFTEANVAESSLRLKLDKFISTIEEKAASLNSRVQIPADAEVCLEIGEDGECSYYVADVKNRCIFWLDSVDASEWLDPFGIESKDHFQHILALEFWTHIECFPNCRRQPLSGLEDEVMETLSYMTIDAMTSADSTVPIRPAEIRLIVKSMKDIQDLTNGADSTCAVFILARIMSIIVNDRYYNMYGFHGARLSAFQSIRGDCPTKNNHSVFMQCLSPLLFYAPSNYLWKIKRLHVDGVIRQCWWEEFHNKFDSDLSGIIVLSTVFLAANAAILAAPDILSRVASTTLPAAAETANRISAVTSIGGILVGLQLKAQDIRINSKGHGGSMSHAVTYLSWSKRRPEFLAIHLSLPHAMLMWSIATCAASIAIRCFSAINGTPDPVSRILLAIFWSITLASIFWSFLTGWEFANHAHWSGALKETHKSKVHGTCKEIRAMNDTHRAESTNYLSCIEKAGEY